MTTTEMNIDTRKQILASILGISTTEIDTASYDDEVLEAEGGEWLVLSDDEANEKAQEQIEQSLWAFNASFILSQCGLPQALEDAIKAMQEKECESCNETILEMLEACNVTIQDFAAAAISADGRGHFMSSYDGVETEYRTDDGEIVYAYRIN